MTEIKEEMRGVKIDISKRLEQAELHFANKGGASSSHAINRVS
jgi:hypothetical protein